ncbi:MAG: SRPBCC domain-containing protein [Anaerolineales bacterium]
MAKKQALKFQQIVPAAPAEVYLALTNATALREWFCDVVHIEPHKGGRVYFAWNQGYNTVGEITKLTLDKKVAYTWLGRGEPGPTSVEISIAPKKGGSSVTVIHSGLGAGKKWKAPEAAIRLGWQRGLENLASVFDTGHDLRLTMRPMLGVSGVEEVTPEMAQRLGVPVQRGVRIDGTVPGMGAEAAGLQKDDVLVSVGGQKISSWPSLTAVLAAHRAGEKLPVSLYRGAEKRKETMELSKRPLPEIPATAAELAETVRKIYEQTDAELGQALASISAEAANSRPRAGEWNVKEVLAHLLLGERDNQVFISELVAGDERTSSNFFGNSQLRTAATAETFGSARGLFEALKHSETETVAMLAGLPEEFVKRKRSYWRLAMSVVQTADHTHEHLRQIAVAAAPPEPVNAAEPAAVVESDQNPVEAP